MSTFRKEIETIELILMGSRWATVPIPHEIQTVIDEYHRIVQSGRVRIRSRRVALQIFFSSRAIDSLLEYIVVRDITGRGDPVVGHFTIGRCLRYIRNTGIQNAGAPPANLPFAIDADLLSKVLQHRNHYLHKAGQFPADAELEEFVFTSVAGIQALAAL